MYFQTISEAFSVGQNIATRAKTGNSLPTPDWESTIQSLYDEVKDFYPQWISPFRAPKYPMTGHYTQVTFHNSLPSLKKFQYYRHSYSSIRMFYLNTLDLFNIYIFHFICIKYYAENLYIFKDTYGKHILFAIKNL